MRTPICNYNYDSGVNYNLYLYKSYYASNGRLYLALDYYDEEEKDYQIFDDLTINLNDLMIENDNIIFTNGDIPEEILEKLEDIGLIAYLDTVKYNYGTYYKYIVNEDVMNKYLKEEK